MKDLEDQFDYIMRQVMKDDRKKEKIKNQVVRQNRTTENSSSTDKLDFVQ